MKKDIIKNILIENQKMVFTSALSRDLMIPEIKKVITIVGTRRAGKTYFLFDLIGKFREKGLGEHILYLNFEDDRIFPMQLEDLGLIIEAYYELYPEKKKETVYAFFDEIQLVANWEKFIRRIYDTENIRIFITGSSSRLLQTEIDSSLRGRTLSFELFPLSFREYLRFKNIPVEFYGSSATSLIKNALESYFMNGGFPELINFSPEMAKSTLQNYIQMIIFKDMIDRYQIKNHFLIKYLVHYCFRNISSLLSVNKLYNELKSMGAAIAKNTLYQYLGYLEDSFAAFTTTIFTESYREQIRNPKKIFAVDTGLYTSQVIRADRGRLFENVVFTELRRKNQEIFYFRKKQEVDFCVKNQEKLQLINVCADLESPSTLKREVDALLEAMRFLNLSESVIINGDKEDIIQVDKLQIKVIPLWKWLIQ